MVKKRLKKKDFYLQVLYEFEIDTNLTRIKKNLKLKKQNLNYYIAKLRQLGFLKQVDTGWYEVTEEGKKATKYGKNLTTNLEQDFIRGHAYVWNIEIEKIPNTWKDRIKVLKKFKIDYKLVGALKDVPRIKVLGRKIWLCNKHIRIFDIEKASYYGETAQESKTNAKVQAFRILRALENKLGIKLSNDKLTFQKEHYALIKNDLAIHHNRKNIIMRINDEEGEWLLIDDSLEKGGELENVGKKAFKTNQLVQNWWNDHKKNNFEVTASYVLQNLNELIESQKNTDTRMQELVAITKYIIQEISILKGK